MTEIERDIEKQQQNKRGRSVPQKTGLLGIIRSEWRSSHYGNRIWLMHGSQFRRPANRRGLVGRHVVETCKTQLDAATKQAGATRSYPSPETDKRVTTYWTADERIRTNAVTW